MSEQLRLTGMVILSAPAGEFDKRVVLLTKERGKITAFARGARRPRSPLLAASCAFAFGSFGLYEGRSAYTLVSADIQDFFPELVTDLDKSCYGSYFLELAGYYGRENLEAVQMLNLLYVALRALGKPSLPKPLVRFVYEIRLLVINGEYPQELSQDLSLSKSARYAIWYAVNAPLERLYTFTVTPEVLGELRRSQEKVMAGTLDKRPRSLAILESIADE